MMDQIIRVAWDLNENTENRYQLVYEIAELAKKLVDETQAKKAHDDFNFEENFDTTYKKENPVEHAIMVKAAEADDDSPSGFNFTNFEQKVRGDSNFLIRGING